MPTGFRRRIHRRGTFRTTSGKFLPAIYILLPDAYTSSFLGGRLRRSCRQWVGINGDTGTDSGRAAQHSGRGGGGGGKHNRGHEEAENIGYSCGGSILVSSIHNNIAISFRI
jgi:hypothetical protein